MWSARLEDQMEDFGKQSTVIRELFLSDILCDLDQHINHAGFEKHLNNPFLAQRGFYAKACKDSNIKTV